MSNAPRFENQQIVNSFNLFVDSERCVVQGDNQSRGDDLHIQFECNSVEAGDGEVIKLSVTEFSMPNTLDMIDFNNSRGIFQGTSTFKKVRAPGPPPGTLVPPQDFDFGINETVDLLDRQNYKNVFDIAVSFALNMKTQLDRLVDTSVKAFEPEIIYPEYDTVYKITSYVSPGLTTPGFPAYEAFKVGKNPEDTGARTLQLKFTCKDVGHGSVAVPTGSPSAHNISNLKIKLPPTVGDLYSILGGLRCDRPDDITFSSLQISPASIAALSTEIEITGYFNMMRYSEPNVYLRSSTGQNGLEMSVLQANVISTGNALVSDIVTSDILGKFPRYTPGNAETIEYHANSDTEFFINLQQRKLTSLRLFLTDSKGRKLGRFTSDVGGGTAAGRETYPETNPPTYASQEQDTLGNLFFTAVIKVDVIKASNPVKLDSQVFPPPANGSKSGGVLPYTGFQNRF